MGTTVRGILPRRGAVFHHPLAVGTIVPRRQSRLVTAKASGFPRYITRFNLSQRRSDSRREYGTQRKIQISKSVQAGSSENPKRREAGGVVKISGPSILLGSRGRRAKRPRPMTIRCADDRELAACHVNSAAAIVRGSWKSNCEKAPAAAPINAPPPLCTIRG